MFPSSSSLLLSVFVGALVPITVVSSVWLRLLTVALCFPVVVVVSQDGSRFYEALLERVRRVHNNARGLVTARMMQRRDVQLVSALVSLPLSLRLPFPAPAT